MYTHTHSKTNLFLNNFRFWKDVGGCMSKISTEEQPIIHLMECNVAGNRQGTEVSIQQ